MTDDPTDTTTDSTDPTSNADEEIAVDEREADADFLADRGPEASPSVHRVTSASEEAHRRDALDRLDRFEAGEEVPRVVNFQDPSDLRSLLTDRRVELLRSVMADPPDSIRGLAKRLDRDVKSVHDDLTVLAEYDVVRFESNGRAKRVVVPYDTIEVSLEISAPDAAGDVGPA